MALKNKVKKEDQFKEIEINVSPLPLTEYFTNEYLTENRRKPDEFELNDYIKDKLEYLR
jgi:hypothetical protein